MTAESHTVRQPVRNLIFSRLAEAGSPMPVSVIKYYNADVMKKIISFTGSIKFAGIILFLIVLLSLIGSFIPQGNSTALMGKLDKAFGTNAHYVYDFLTISGFIDIYTSPIFIVLLFLFAISLSICTYRLLPFMMTGYRYVSISSLQNECKSTISENEILQQFIHNGWKIHKLHDGLYKATKHAIGRAGVIVLHSGIIIVLLGSLVGYMFGYKAFMNILEGDSDNVAVLPDGTLIPLGFDIRCDSFTVTYYPGTKRAKSYESTLTVIDKNKPVKMTTIDVNKPLTHNDITFYQTSFGMYPNKNVKIIFSVEKDGVVSHLSKRFDEPFKISENLIGKVTDFAPSLAADEEGRIFSSSENMLNPAILLEIYDIDQPLLRAWVMKHNPESGNFAEAGFSVTFEDMFGAEYTGISVKKDPGTPLIYLGFILVCIGLGLIYLLNYTAVFFKFAEKDGKDIIVYTLRQQRKHPLVKPALKVKKIFGDETA